MRCPSCGTENRPGIQFCTRCGGGLIRACPSCGTAAAEGDSFCGSCGASLDPSSAVDRPAPQPAASPPQVARSCPQVERRHVSVLFADLVGFTPLSAHRDAEEVRDLLSRYFQESRSIVQRYGGTVEKFIGDAVMAVWGVPTAQEDDAERAVRAALDLVDAVSVLGSEVGEPDLRARAGVLSGEAAVNLGAESEGMVAGDLVNTASRVQSAAEPGSVLVGSATRALTEAAVEYADAGEHRLKGKPEAVRLWRALRVVAGRGGSRRPTSLEPPFTGREHELRLLKDYLHATYQERRTRLVSIVGVAGIGKSRLGWELEKYVDGLTQRVLWHRGRCLAYGDGVTYWALAEMVRTRCGVVENEPADQVRAKLRATIEQYVTDTDELRWMEPRLAQLLSLEERSTSDPRDLFAAWRFFFEQLARDQLTVLVFEDLQWADGGLLDFIEYLLEWSRTSPILVITSARPELTERRPGWGAGRRGMTSLYLDPLPPEAMDALLTGMVPGLSLELRQRIGDRAAGIPLYAVETVRMLLDRSLIVDKGNGVFQVERPLDALEIPESLHAMIAARIDNLPAEERSVLQDAAVLGKSFTVQAIHALSNGDPRDLDTAMQRLVAKDILAIQSDPRSPERGQYTFVQDPVRGVALGMLSRHDRKLRHLAAAEYLSGTWLEEDEIAEVVAQHLVDAYEAEPNADDAAELREQARSALVRAAERATTLAAGEVALRHYERALQLGGADADVASLHECAGEAAYQCADNSSSREHLDAALLLHEQNHELIGKARVITRLAQLDHRAGLFDQAEARLQQAMEVLIGSTDDSLQRDAVLAEACYQYGANRYHIGEPGAALPLLEQALTIAERRNLPVWLLAALDVKSWVLQTLGRTNEAMIISQGALQLARARNQLRDEAIIGMNLAELLEGQDDMQAAIEQAQEAEEGARRVGLGRVVLYSRLERILALFELGRWREAAQMAAASDGEDAPEALDLSEMAKFLDAVWLDIHRGALDEARTLIARAGAMQQERETPGVELTLMLGAARAALANAEANFSTALEAAQAALETMKDTSYPLMERKAVIEAVEAAFGIGDQDVLAQQLQVAAERFPKGGSPSMDAHSLRWHARVAALNRDEEEAQRRFNAAIGAFTELGRQFWVAVSQLEYAESLEQIGRADDAEPHRAAARATFEELGAVPWVDRAQTMPITRVAVR